MKALLLVTALAALLVTGMAQAQTRCVRIGNSVVCDDYDSGDRTTCRQVGRSVVCY
jgi:hypothetical protein